MPKFIQINLTGENDKESPLKAIYTLHDKYNNIEFIDNLKIYGINLEKAKEMWYIKSSKTSLIGLLDCDKEELNKA